MGAHTEREFKGMDLAVLHHVELKPFGWSVAFSDSNLRYVVAPVNLLDDHLGPRNRRYGLECTCPDFIQAGNRCKHIAAVYFWQQLHNYSEHEYLWPDSPSKT
jgi:hypothetical protein